MIFKKPKKSFVAIVSVHIPVGVADTNAVQPLYFECRQRSSINVRAESFRLALTAVDIMTFGEDGL